MTVNRRIKESPIEQGVDEQIAYTLTTTPWGSSPTSVEVKAYDFTGGSYTDVSATVLFGSASVNGDIITTPVVKSLTLGSIYSLEIKFTVSGNIMESFCVINAAR